MVQNRSALKDILRQRADENMSCDNSEVIDSSYQLLFGVPESKQTIAHLPTDKLVDFFTAELHFRDLMEDELWALAESIENIGLQDEAIVRRIPNSDKYEIIAGMHRRKAHQLKGWKTIRSKIIEATDSQAILIATDTNLKRRQRLLPSEKGFAYRLQVEAMRHQGKKIALPETSVQFEQKLTTREKVALIYGVKASDVQRYVRLTYLIPQLLDAVDKGSVSLVAGAEISYYDEATQEAIRDLCLIEKVGPLNVKTADRIRKTYKPPTVSAAMLRVLFSSAATHTATPKIISFQRNKFKPYLNKLPDEKELERLFLEFLQERFG